MRSADGRGEDAPYGVRLGGVGPRGGTRLHYPDLLLNTASGHRVAVELELTGKGRTARERILGGYAIDNRIDAVLYLARDERIARAVRASARAAGISDMVHVRTVRFPPPPQPVQIDRPGDRAGSARAGRVASGESRGCGTSGDGRGSGTRGGSAAVRSRSRWRRPPYWTLVALALLASLPPGWATVALGARAGGTAGVRDRGRRRARAAARGPAIALGTGTRGATVSLSDRELGAHALIVGAAGAGKSTTLLAIVCDRVARGLPVVALDLKGSPAFADQLRAAALAAGRPFALWTPDGPSHWNPLAHGNATELKDKLIATERFTEPHYQRAAERYVQLTLQVLLAAGRQPSLDAVVTLLEPRRLAAATRQLRAPFAEHVQDYLAGMSADQLSAVRGLGTRLAVLSESDAGPWLSGTPPTARRDGTIDRRPRPRRTRGRPVQPQLECLRQVRGAARNAGDPGSDQRHRPAAEPWRRGAGAGDDRDRRVLGAGVRPRAGAAGARPRGRRTVLVATQEMADLERAGSGFRDQVLGLTAVKLVHRQDVPGSAQLVAQMAGTEYVWEQTRRSRSPLLGGSSYRGTRREVERFVVHPNEIKTLRTGQAVLLSKTPRARVLQRLHVRPSAVARDQPEPGVTR